MCVYQTAVRRFFRVPDWIVNANHLHISTLLLTKSKKKAMTSKKYNFNDVEKAST